MQVPKQNDSYPFQAASIVLAPSAPNQLCSSFTSATAADRAASVSCPKETTSEQQLLDSASSGHSRTSVSPKQLDQVPDCIITVIQQLETQSGSRCKGIRTDNGSEYVNKTVQAFCNSKGILHQHSAPYSPEQNGAAQRHA
ncbi:hypothetical protein QJQ45_026044 [Haematococcus lacustris]|nr:hypothetical protein QJQ45_026044 [Haematococcus lacustris]